MQNNIILVGLTIRSQIKR